MAVNYSVPWIKMNGHYKTGLPYQPVHFVDSGWEIKVIVDFINNAVETVSGEMDVMLQVATV